MGMGAHVDALAGGKIHRAEIIQKDEGAKRAPRRLWQKAGDDEAIAKIVGLAGHRDHDTSLAGQKEKL